jgi:adenylate kinase family enzyme
VHGVQPLPGRRICVVGTSGSGKTFVAHAVARRLGIPYVSNDALIWRPNWEPVPDHERFPAFDQATRGESWTFDGNLGPRPEDELVLSRCDTVVWLDLPRWQVMLAITRRTLWRAITRQPLFHGNVERWRTALSRDSMIAWAWRTYPRRKAQYVRLFNDPAHVELVRIRLTSRREVNRWLDSLPRTS